jgi:hypothetical protein
MGTRAWERITTMSEMAEKQRGQHENFLRKKYAELLERQTE